MCGTRNIPAISLTIVSPLVKSKFCASQDMPTRSLSWVMSLVIVRFRLLAPVCSRRFCSATEKLHLPRKSDASGAAVLNENFGERTQRFSARPIALPLARQGKPGDRRYAGLHHAPNCHVVRLDGNPTRSVRYGIHIIAFALRLYCRHRQTHLGPERGNDELFTSRLLHRLDDALIFPRVDEGAIDRLLIGKHVLDVFDQ